MHSYQSEIVNLKLPVHANVVSALLVYITGPLFKPSAGKIGAALGLG